MQQFEKAIPAMMKGYDEFTALNQATLDAFMKASNVLVKGYEDIGKEYFKFAQASAEASAEAAKSMMSAKTLKEVVDLQSGYARSSFDTLVAEGTKLNEMTVKVANEAIQPIQTQFNKTMERVFKVSAAA
ncbi:MAG: phasin family protein [Alphaproteobacteria bacterium]